MVDAECKAARKRRGNTTWLDKVTHPITDLVVGSWVDGKVRNILPYGAYVDIGAEKDGLLHVKDMSVCFVSNPHDKVEPGQLVNVRVKHVATNPSVIALSLVPEKGKLFCIFPPPPPPPPALVCPMCWGVRSKLFYGGVEGR